MATVYGAQSFAQILGVSFFIYILLLMSIFTLIGLMLKGGNRIRYGDIFLQNEKNGIKDDGEPLVDKDSGDEDDVYN